MKILSIGNSFSQDAQAYLYRIARAAGTPMKTVNLMIGGCSLERHYRNMLSQADAYGFELNGMATGLSVSLDRALLSDTWDVITLQQVSHASPRYETFQPYLDALAQYVRRCQPKAKLYLQQTWAYEAGGRRLCVELGYQTPAQMLSDLKASYANAAQDIAADGVIPSGEVLLRALELGAPTVHRDGFHAGLGLGRYLLGLTWYGTLTGKDTDGLRITDFDAPITEAELRIAHQAVKDVLHP